jgi:hypothetical protein
LLELASLGAIGREDRAVRGDSGPAFLGLGEQNAVIGIPNKLTDKLAGRRPTPPGKPV